MSRRADPPTLATARSAAQAIHDRRSKERPQDPLPDPADLDQMVEFVLKHRRVSKETREHDAVDIVVITDYLRSRADDLQRRGIDMARELGLSFTTIGTPIGLSRQAAYQRRLRLEAGNLNNPDTGLPIPHTEKAVRAAIRQRSADLAVANATALDLMDLIEQLVNALAAAPDTPLSDEDVEDPLTDLLRFFEAGDQATHGPAIVANARLLVGALRTHNTPQGCGDLLNRLAAALPGRRRSSS